MKSSVILPSIRHIVSVSSGKGGVGKSTIAFHLASTLSEAGLAVGLLDADIYGPSLPILTGLQGPPFLKDNRFLPLQVDALKVMSIGFLVDPKSPIIWRGLLVQKALKQLLEDVEWGALDILIVDMPPGTGDIPLTFHQWAPLSGGIVVSVGDILSWVDAYKGREMLRKLKIPFLGYVENMSTIQCPHCSARVALVPSSLIEDEARKANDPFLGSIPFDLSLRHAPFCAEGEATKFFKQMGEKIWTVLGL